MVVKSKKYITNGFAIYIRDPKEAESVRIKIRYSSINPLLEWLECLDTKLIYDEERFNLNNASYIETFTYNIRSGFYTIEISYKVGVYIQDNQSITIGLTKSEKACHINFPNSSYKLL